MKNNHLLMFVLLALPILMHPSTDYRVVSVFDTTVSVKIKSLGQEVGAFDLKPGEVKTVTTNLANCVDQVWVDFHDGKGYQNIGGGVCAGSVACLTDEANYPHVLAKPFYGQLSKELPCTAEKLGAVFGGGVAAGAGAVAAPTIAGAASGAAVGISSVSGAASGTVGASLAAGVISENIALGAAGATAAAAPVVAIPAAVITAGAMLGCGLADAFVVAGQCRGKPKQDGSQLILSAEDWQDAQSTIESRERTRAVVKDQLNKAFAHAKNMMQKTEAAQIEGTQAKLTTGVQKTQTAIEQNAQATIDDVRKKMQEALRVVSGQKVS